METSGDLSAETTSPLQDDPLWSAPASMTVVIVSDLQGGVRLSLTGHMHYQYIVEKDGLWEILSGMPFSGRHLAGNLAIGRDSAVYYVSPVNFAKYGSSYRKELAALDQEYSSYMTEVFSTLLDQEKIRGTEKKKVLDLINRYFLYFGN